MWQDIAVYAIIAVAGGLTLRSFYKKLTGKGSCCSGGGSCGGSCPQGAAPGRGLPMADRGPCCCK
ncbi:MAG: FeoB-associated Cys-rich membrane protein [Desulfovibrio sp.]|jgi:hypothetical protein|nr:FeoB-associated Cys-rich membrane protein [Desulfovibrio sp.]